MCVVSMIGDHYSDKWKDKWPIPPGGWPHIPVLPSMPTVPDGHIPTSKAFPHFITKEEFDALKKEVEEMKELLERALEYDKRTNQPHCEMEEKVKLLKEVAKAVGVDLSDIFGRDSNG